MRKLVIFTISLMLLSGGIVNICAIAQDSDELGGDKKKTENISLKQFEKNMAHSFRRDFWEPMLKEFNSGNYLMVIPMIKDALKGDSNLYITNKQECEIVLRYYLALCYHNLNFKKEAKEQYDYVSSNAEGTDLAFYSKKAMACMDDPNSPACTGKKKEKKPELSELEKAQQDEIKQLRQQVTKLQNELAPKVNPNDDDISRFIKSKQAIHPAAMDRITIERMERKMQEAEYIKKQQEGNNQQINN